MPTLPNLPPVSDSVAARILDAFNDQKDGDGNAIPPATAYRQWLRNSLVRHVQASEARKSQSSLEANLPLV